MNGYRSVLATKGLLLLGLVLPAAGCVAAAAGAGAAGAIYLTSRGAESVVEGSVDQVGTRTEAVMSEMGISQDEVKRSGDSREYKGKQGENDVTIKLDRESESTTKVEVSARKNLAEWDKDYAKAVLSRIVEKG